MNNLTICYSRWSKIVIIYIKVCKYIKIKCDKVLSLTLDLINNTASLFSQGLDLLFTHKLVHFLTSTLCGSKEFPPSIKIGHKGYFF